MIAAEKIAPMITEPLTWSQICERYPDRWVCVVEIEWDEPRQFHFRTARVVGHGTTRREPFVQARPWWDHYQQIGHYYTGKIVAAGLLASLDGEPTEAVEAAWTAEIERRARAAIANPDDDVAWETVRAELHAE